jgi:hypothetical protein
MAEPQDPAPQPVTHKVAREIVNPLAPPPVRILLEPSLQSDDDFFLESAKANKPASGGVKFGPISMRAKAGKTHTVVEFDQIRDASIYKLLHSRGTGSQGGPQRDLIDSHIPGNTLSHPQWKTPGLPSTKFQEKRDKNPPIHTPPHTDDPLLRDDVTDFPKLRVQEPKIEGNS